MIEKETQSSEQWNIPVDLLMIDSVRLVAPRQRFVFRLLSVGH